MYPKVEARSGKSTLPEPLSARNHIAANLAVDRDDFEYALFAQEGGLGKAHQIFGSELSRIIEELNEALAA